MKDDFGDIWICPNCGRAKLHWDSDCSFDEMDFEGNGIVSEFHFVECGADITMFIPETNPYKEETEETL